MLPITSRCCGACRQVLRSTSTPYARAFSGAARRLADNNANNLAAGANRWRAGPAPPRLPKEEQEIFERLQQQSTGAFSTPRAAETESVSTEAKEGEAGEVQMSSGGRSAEAEKMLEQLRAKARVKADGEGEELHPNVRRGAAPEFEGDVNPKTGEVGGPKNEPLRWGVSSDWSYNGRVTDF